MTSYHICSYVICVVQMHSRVVGDGPMVTPSVVSRYVHDSPGVMLAAGEAASGRNELSKEEFTSLIQSTIRQSGVRSPAVPVALAGSRQGALHSLPLGRVQGPAGDVRDQFSGTGLPGCVTVNAWPYPGGTNIHYRLFRLFHRPVVHQ